MKILKQFGSRKPEAEKNNLPRYREGELLDCVGVKNDGDFDMTWVRIKSGAPVVHNLHVASHPKEYQLESQGKPVEEVFTPEAEYVGVVIGHLRFGATPQALLTGVEPTRILQPGEDPGFSNVSLFQRSILELLAGGGRADLANLYRTRIGALKPLRAGYAYDNFLPPHPALLTDLSPTL